MDGCVGAGTSCDAEEGKAAFCILALAVPVEDPSRIGTVPLVDGEVPGKADMVPESDFCGRSRLAVEYIGYT